MTLRGYDFSDFLIRHMVQENHKPIEGPGFPVPGTTLRPVLCGFCLVEWPCPQIDALRGWEMARHGDLTAHAEGPTDSEMPG